MRGGRGVEGREGTGEGGVWRGGRDGRWGGREGREVGEWRGDGREGRADLRSKKTPTTINRDVNIDFGRIGVCWLTFWTIRVYIFLIIGLP